MKKASEYRDHAEECRQLASRMALGEHRDQLLAMAQTWDDLARDRSERVRKYPDQALSGERQEEERHFGPPGAADKRGGH